MSLDIVGGQRQDDQPSKYNEEIAASLNFNHLEWGSVWSLCGNVCKRTDMQCLVDHLADRVRFPTPNDVDGLGTEDVERLAGVLRDEVDSGRFAKGLVELQLEDPETAAFLTWAVPKFLTFLEHVDSFIVF